MVANTMSAEISPADAARSYNRRLEKLAVRTMLTTAFLLTTCIAWATCAVLFLPESNPAYVFLLLTPFGLAACFLLLLLDALGQWRLIKGRNWKTLTPRFERRSGVSPNSTTAAPTVQTPARDTA